jgi:plasmid stabilization system protein ParE
MPRLPYIIVYRYDAATGDLGILAVFHARRNRSS